MPGGGSSGGRRSELTHWVWPLPPAGPVTIVCEWPGMGIPESRGQLDGDVIRQAAARSRELWGAG